MTYRLYNRLGSAGLAVEAAFEYAGIPFELTEVASTAGAPMPESFREINPMGQVPALVLASGELLTETSAILIYLSAAHPESSLGPRPDGQGYGRFVRWIIFCGVNVHEAGSRMIYPFRFTTDPAAEDAVRDAARDRLVQSLRVLDDAVGSGPFLLGDTMTAADIYTAMFYSWHLHKVDLPHLERLHASVMDNAKVANVFNRHNARKK